MSIYAIGYNSDFFVISITICPFFQKFSKDRDMISSSKYKPIKKFFTFYLFIDIFVSISILKIQDIIDFFTQQKTTKSRS